MKKNRYSKLASKIARRYIGRPGLVGIIWVGSSTFGIEDEFVDVDIRLLIDRDDKYSPMEQFVEEGVQIEVDEMSFDWLLSDTDYDSEQNWMRTQGIILHDPDERVKAGFKKSNSIAVKGKEALLWNSFKALFNHHDVKKCLKRGERMTAFLLISKTIDQLLRFLFLVNNKPVPSFKWRWHFVKELKLIDTRKVEKLIPDGLGSLEKCLPALLDIEKMAQDMMIKAGFSKEKVMEPWRF